MHIAEAENVVGCINSRMVKYMKVLKPFSYYDLIKEAIEASPGHFATAAMIFEYAQRRYPSIFLDANSITWKGNIRQLLSKHPEFERQKNEYRKRLHFWIHRPPKSTAEEQKQLYMCLNFSDREGPPRSRRGVPDWMDFDKENACGRNADMQCNMGDKMLWQQGMDGILTLEGPEAKFDNSIFKDFFREGSLMDKKAFFADAQDDIILCCGCMGICRCADPPSGIYNEYTPLSHGRYIEYGFWFQSGISENDTGEDAWDKMWFNATAYSKRKGQ